VKQNCPHCIAKNGSSELRARAVRAGWFRRKSDCKWVQRFRCLDCLKYFSTATFHPCFRQKKRHFNFSIFKNLSSSVSQRRIAKNLNLNRKTVVRKFLYLGLRCNALLDEMNRMLPKAIEVQFDEMESIEHTKCKPLSIPLAVEQRSRRILGFQMARMPAKGKLAAIALKKYGKRIDERRAARARLLEQIAPFIEKDAILKSDQNPFYPAEVKTHLPSVTHVSFKGQRGSLTGQGELKKVRHDPLFALNHTCAMLRANINRLVRKTWCTTKIPQRLALHIAIYAVYHNKYLINDS
jgi:hypothetical protein